MSDYIHFFGTTGDKALMFADKLQAGGLFISINGNRIIMDPGPGTMRAFCKSYPNLIYEIDAIILSHVHFDHSNEINIFIEGMTKEGKEHRGIVFTSKEALQGSIKSYVTDFPEKIVIIEEYKEYTLNNVIIKTSGAHRHGVENYGFIFKSGAKTVSMITDTAYFDGLLEGYPESDCLVINVPYADKPIGKKIKHLSLEDLSPIINHIKPKQVFLTHFGESIFNRGPQEIATNLASTHGIEVISALDDSKYII